MVSLGYDNYSNNLSEQLIENCDAVHPEPPLNAPFDPPDTRVQTSAVIGLQVFIMVDLLAIAFLLPIVPDLPTGIFSMIVYMHCGVWAISYILDSYLRRQHSLLSCYGFIEFYQKTKNLRRTSLNIMSCGTIMMLLISVFLHDYCDNRRDDCPKGVHDYYYLQLIIVLESSIILPVLIYYLKLNHEFHRSKVLPDIESQDFIASILQTRSSVEIGYRDNSPAEDIAEKQSDMIRYLKRYNAFLKKKLLRINGELETTRSRNQSNA